MTPLFVFLLIQRSKVCQYSSFDSMRGLLTRQMAEHEGVTEALKARDQMAWVRAMNSIKMRAEEIVLNDLIYT